MALVGTSGCGKSTAVSLIPRLYDVEMGSVVKYKKCFTPSNVL